MALTSSEQRKGDVVKNEPETFLMGFTDGGWEEPVWPRTLALIERLKAENAELRAKLSSSPATATGSEGDKIVSLLDALREGSASRVTVWCDNSEPDEPTSRIEVTDSWTQWEPRVFHGASLGEVLAMAVEEKRDKEKSVGQEIVDRLQKFNEQIEADPERLKRAIATGESTPAHQFPRAFVAHGSGRNWEGVRWSDGACTIHVADDTPHNVSMYDVSRYGYRIIAWADNGDTSQ